MHVSPLYRTLSASVEPEGDRPDLVCRVGHVAVQADQQRRAASGDREAQHPPVQGERARVPADGTGPASAAGTARRYPRPCGVPRRRTRRRSTGAAPTWPRHCPVPRRSRARRRQFPAQLLVGRQRRVLARRRQWFSSSTQHHTSPAERSSPNSRFRWARVTRSPHRAVRYTTGGASGSRFRGMRLLQHRTPTKPRMPSGKRPGHPPAGTPAAARPRSPQRTYPGIRPPRQHRPGPRPEARDAPPTN